MGMAKFCYSGPSNNAISQDTEGPPNFRFNQVSKHSRKTEAHGFELEIDSLEKNILMQNWLKYYITTLTILIFKSQN